MGDPSWQGQDRLLHAVLWTGSDRPSLLRTLVTKALFACRHVLPVSQAACSADARKLRAFFAALKHMCTESVDGARVAFLAIVCPPTPQFTYHLAARHTTLLGLPVFWSGTPPNSCKLLVVYVHGGGFVSGDYSGYQGMCEDLGQALGPDTCVLFPQYPLAPEVNWLRIVNKVTASITAAAKQDVPLAVFADSAGGAIALASCLALCAGKGPKPSGSQCSSATCRVPPPSPLRPCSTTVSAATQLRATTASKRACVFMHTRAALENVANGTREEEQADGA